IPNFLAAQTRSKCARVKGNMKTCATGLEAYYVDANDYPPATAGGAGVFTWRFPVAVTTPVAYITRVPDDVFDTYAAYGPGFLPMKYRTAGWALAGTGAPTRLSMWVNESDGLRTTDIELRLREDLNKTPYKYAIFSMGPGQALHRAAAGSGFWNDGVSSAMLTETRYPAPFRLWYDPTNGVTSIGHVVRLSGGAVSP
ncbi:MAG: hypothetical protein QME64_11755, partial [bacterium]|nr:hypothetical protein [bacterium]